jgi:hypothetical protein
VKKSSFIVFSLITIFFLALNLSESTERLNDGLLLNLVFSSSSSSVFLTFLVSLRGVGWILVWLYCCIDCLLSRESSADSIFFFALSIFLLSCNWGETLPIFPL